MGQFEKIVVLLALFLVTLILVVTYSGEEEGSLQLNMGQETLAAAAGGSMARDDAGAGANPRTRNDARGGPSSLDFPEDAGQSSNYNGQGGTLDADQGAEPMDLEARSLQDRSRQEALRNAGKSKPDLLLDDRFEARPRTGAEIPEGSVLVTVDGLRETWNEEIMEYDWQRQDSWHGLATRFYGDGNMAALLRQFNEGATYIAPGTPVLVPVFDGREDSAAVASQEPAPREELSEERGTLYRVVEGDSLWVISKKVYGTGTLWEKIFEANQDVMRKPDSVKVGMGLRIP